MEGVYREIDSGTFAREWRRPLSRLILKALRHFATRQKLNKVEAAVRSRLGCADPADPASAEEASAEEIRRILADPAVRKELQGFMGTSGESDPLPG